MNTYVVRGFNKAFTKFLREDVQAESEGHAIRLFRSKHPEAGPLHCRPPKHAEAVLDALASLPAADRIAA